MFSLKAMQPRSMLILWLLLALVGCSNQKNHHDSGKESGAKEEQPNLCEILGKDQCVFHLRGETGLRQCANEQMDS